MLVESAAGTNLQTIQENDCTWVSVERPTASEIEYLVRQYGINRSDLADVVDRGGASGVWRRSSYAIVVALVPILSSGPGRPSLALSPVTLIVGPSFVVMIHLGEIRPLLRLFRQLETDDAARLGAFESGATGVVRSIAQRLLDAIAAARARIERAIAEEEELASRPGSQRVAQQRIALALRLRSEARQIRRSTTPLPELLRSLSQLGQSESADREAWEHIAIRADRLVGALDDDLSALDGILIASAAMSTIESARDNRLLATVALLTLPVLVVAGLLTLPGGSPLASQPGGYAAALGCAGAVFLIALFIARRRGMI